MGAIVVGVDGSEESQRALRWAVEEARLHAADVRALYVFQHTPAWQLYGYAEGMPVVDADASVLSEEDARREDQERAQALVDHMVAELGDTAGVTVRPEAVEARRPAAALIDASQDASMIVVGSRGRGGFAGLLLGSVSHQTATHAHCPVVIIGSEQDED